MINKRHFIGLAIWITVVCFVAPVAWAGRGAIGQHKKRGWVPGELLVKYKRSQGTLVSKSRGRHWRAATLRRFKSVRIHRVKIARGMTVEDALKQCQRDPEVAYAEPNYIRQISEIPNDPDFGGLWGLDNLGQAGGAIDADIDAPEAWDTQTGSRDVVVAVLDTGIDWNHEDLADNIWVHPNEVVGDANGDGFPGVQGVDDDGDGLIDEDSQGRQPGDSGYSNDLVGDDDENGFEDDIRGWDFVNNDNNPDDDNNENDSYHGTHVSGTIGAEGNNGVGITGVTWAVSIMPLKTLNQEGTGTVADEIAAIEYAIANGAKIINASFSGVDDSLLEYDAIKSARDAGILLVAAAGNRGTDNDNAPEYPAAYDLDNIIAVAATDRNDALPSFSNYGAISVDVAAPGVQILSTIRDNEYEEKSGTSMAAPHVSGLAALIWSQDPSLTYSEVKGFIFDGVDVLGTLAGKMLMAGRINANKSVLAAANGNIDVPDFPPSDLVVTTASARQLNLTWTDNASDETGTRIERATNAGGPFSHVGTVAANVESYADVTVNDLTTYYYRVLAFNVAGVTAPSNTDSATTLFAPPDNLWAIIVSSSRIDLFWSDNSSGESGYHIERKTGAAGTYSQIASVGPNVETFKIEGLEASTTYYYRVRAFNDQGVSPYSNEVIATTSAVLTASSVSTDGGGGGGGGCFISAGNVDIWSTLWLLLLVVIPAGCVVFLRTKSAA